MKRATPTWGDRYAIVPILAVAGLFASDARAALRGPLSQERPVVETYGRQCASCHGDEGRGDGRVARRYRPRPSDFTDPDGVPRRTDEELSEVLTYGRGSMPSFEDVLTPEEIADMVSYVRELSQGENP